MPKNRFLRSHGVCLAIQNYQALPSTNTYLIDLAKEGASEGLVVIADSQSNGRGRLGRSFYSPQGCGLYMSVLLRPRFGADVALRITTAAAVSVAEAIEAVTERRPTIKWVNDIFLDGKKVGGILTEGALREDGSGLRYAVLGIGVNLAEPPGGFPEELEKIAGAIGIDATFDFRDRLAEEILTRFFGYYACLDQSLHFEAYRARLFVLGRTVTVSRGSEFLKANVLDIDHEYRLVVSLSDGQTQLLSDGEISLRL